MKRSGFTEEQILAALKQHAAGASTKELCRQLGIASETLYNWKRKYGGMEVSEARRLRALLIRIQSATACRRPTIP